MTGRPPGPRKIEIVTRRSWRIRKSSANPMFWVLVALDAHGRELGQPVLSAFDQTDLRQSLQIRAGDYVEIIGE